MSAELAALIDHMSRMARELDPATVADIARRIDGLGSSESADKLIVSMPTLRSRSLVQTLARLWRGAPTVLPQALSLALLSARSAVETVSSSQSLELVWTGPTSIVTPMRRSDQALYQLIQSASKRILIVSYIAYRVPHLVSALKAAIGRRVAVDLVVEPAEEVGGKVSFDGFRKIREEVPGLEVFYWPAESRPKGPDGSYGRVHAKCAVADEDMALVSSANLTEFALEKNIELGVLIHGGKIPQAIRAHFAELVLRGELMPLRS